jgi:hypothetical protein
MESEMVGQREQEVIVLSEKNIKNTLITPKQISSSPTPAIHHLPIILYVEMEKLW